MTDMTTDNDLVAWLRAQLDEDEAWARAASAPYPYADGNPPVPLGGVHWEWVAALPYAADRPGYREEWRP